MVSAPIDNYTVHFVPIPTSWAIEGATYTATGRVPPAAVVEGFKQRLPQAG